MSKRIGFYGVAHVHAPGLANTINRLNPNHEIRVWDQDGARANQFCEKFHATSVGDPRALVAGSDAVIVCSETVHHIDALETIVHEGKPALIEKPIVFNQEMLAKSEKLVAESSAPLMAALPCAYSPNFELLVTKVKGGEFGKVIAITATNRGKNPGGWFGDPELAGGGAMVDHTVHVADLFWRLLDADPSSVYAVAGNPMTGGAAEDSGTMMCEYPSGVFATLDFSWSIPRSYPTWGDVKVKVTCETGVYEMSLFSQAADVYASDRHYMSGFGSALEAKMVSEFFSAIDGGPAPRTSLPDALRADRVLIAALESVREKRAIPA